MWPDVADLHPVSTHGPIRSLGRRTTLRCVPGQTGEIDRKVMTMLVNVVVGVLVIGWVLWRQMRPQAVTASPKAAIIITAIGLVGAVQFVQHHPISIGAQAVLVLSAVVGLGIAAVRGLTVRIWHDETGRLMSRGTLPTLVLWIVGIASHVAIDAVGAAGTSGATIVLFIGLSLLGQRLVVQWRGRALATVSAPSTVSALHR